MRSVSRETWIGLGVGGIGIAAMAVDHLLEDGGGFAADPPVFAVTTLVVLVVTAALFGRVVPRVKADAERAERAIGVGFACAALAVLTMPFTLWLGLPFPLGAGALALGLIARDGSRRRSATIMAVLGALVVIVGAAGYATLAADKLS